MKERGVRGVREGLERDERARGERGRWREMEKNGKMPKLLIAHFI